MFTPAEEEDRIRAVYAERCIQGVERLYSWNNADVHLAKYRLAAVYSQMLVKFGFRDLSRIHILDVGCGSGGWLRQLHEWGAEPDKLHGIDLLEDRIKTAKSYCSRIDYQWISAWPIPFDDSSMHIVSASTVFSSILDAEARLAMAREMVRVMRPDGLILVYDFRYKNPRNDDVMGIRTGEIRRLFPTLSLTVRTLNLVPPLARRITPRSPLLSLGLQMLLPFLRSHAIYGLRKP